MQSTSLPIADLKDLVSIFSNNQNGISLVKPKVVFKRVEDLFGKSVDISLQGPSSNIGSLTMLEAVIMASLLKILTPKSVFEFGTFLGYSTSILVKNTNSDCKVYSLDLDTAATDLQYAKDYSDQELRSNHVSNDNYLRFVQAEKGPYYLSTLKPDEAKRLKLLKGDSRNFDVKQDSLSGHVDFVFVDGGHEYDIVKSDSINAFKLIGESGIILWHDYNSKIHFDVTRYMDELSKDYNIIHIENTMFAFCLIGRMKNEFFR